MTAPRRVGAERSKTRATVLDAAERVTLGEGYAAVTFRSVAAAAGVTAGLVQYYFPSLDDLFVALIRRRSEANLERLLAALADRPDEPLRVVWEFNTDETSAALMMELLAAANHRKSIRAVITEVTRRARQAQLEALTARWSEYDIDFPGLTPSSLVFLLATVPKMLQLEESVGLDDAHDDAVLLVRSYLQSVEPRVDRNPPKKPTTATRARPRRSRAARPSDPGS